MTTEKWLPDFAQVTGAKYVVLADAIERAVSQGVLRGGDRLPTHRELAAKLSIDLTTVTRAYETAQQRGLVRSRGRLGSYVLEPSTTSFASLEQVDTAMNMPPVLPEFVVEKAIADGTTLLLRRGSGAGLLYQLPGGALQDRVAGATLLTSICAETHHEQVVLTAGGQNALHAILTSILKPGDAVACGEYVYSGLKALAARLAIRLVPLHEMSAGALEQASSREPIRALYLVPTNDNPTAQTLDQRQREAIAATIAKNNIQLIEDDAYGPLATEAPPTVTSFIPGRTWYISSLSKIISPALRIAYVRAPSVASAMQLATGLHEIAIMVPPINAALATAWIQDGTYARLVSAMRKEVTARQALVAKELTDLSYRMLSNSYHLWLPVPENYSGREVAEAIRPSGISIVAAAHFAIGSAPDSAVRISLGGLPDHDTIRRAFRTLGGYLATSKPTSIIV